MLLAHQSELPVKIVLASGSPRRAEILASNLGLTFTISKSTFAEDLGPENFDTPQQYVQATARTKAQEVWDRLADGGQSPDLLIGADTVVVRDGVVLEKPSDAAHATEMLSSLSGRSHHVMTAVVLMMPSAERSFVEVTQVNFHELSPEVIAKYIGTGEPFDKAGGYGVQGMASSFCSGLTGCYFNVVGFPQARFCQELIEML
eukprot:TRINITY_DN20664_c0_g1_i2.p1 TRINITY_DN20664_c0_g1~~TRINITY_DN20664_c0_g1_i2.p1  ORF type:complete len:203 (-),score=45.39 TRINITY_DN20664_c0_g1_i2:263-871(-)